ncbi:MAG: hypothetical protein ACTSWN_01745 [Promethearchaeota archaeon]
MPVHWKCRTKVHSCFGFSACHYNIFKIFHNHIIIIWINNLRKKMEIWRSNEGVLSLIVLNILLFFLIWDNMDCLMINPALFVVEMDVMFLIGFFINLRYVGKNKQISIPLM